MNTDVEPADLFATLLHASSDAIALSRVADGRVVEVNESFLRMFGYERDEVLGRTTMDLQLWIDLGERTRWVAELLARRSVGGMELHLRHRNGDTVIVEASAQIVDYEGDQCILAIDRDVTERRRAELDLRDSEERFRLLSDASFEAVAIHADGKILHVNRAFCELFGYEPAEVIGRSPLDFGTPDGREAVLGQIRAGSEEPYEAKGLRKDGTMFDGELVGRQIPYGGQTVRVVAIRDVTDRKLVEQQLGAALDLEREAAARLRALDEMKNTFLQAVSHDLRTPLASILGTALTLDREDLELSNESARDLIHRLAANARRLDRMLSDLLDLDRLSRGLVEPNRSPTDVGALVRQVVEDAEVLGDRPVEVAADPVEVAVDPVKVRHIVENLVVNVSRHTPPGTPVWIRVEPQDDGALITVEDAGPGVPDDLRRAVFEPFRQGPGASKHNPGVGIGLSLVARFAELHDGRAWVVERAGGGASFRVFLPHHASDAYVARNAR